MEAKQFLVSLIAVFAVLITLTSVIATTGNLDVTINEVSVNGVELSPGQTTTVAGFAAENIPVRVSFTANEDASDARVRVWLSGYRADVSSKTERIELINESTYSKLFSLVLPYDIEPSEETKLYVRVETKTGYKEEEFNLRLQRESYELEILSAEMPQKISAGEVLPIDVVLKNRGYNRLDDLFVRVAIPELGIQKRTYFWDLTPKDDCGTDSCDKEDSTERTIYLNIPAGVQAGVYKVELEVENSDFDEKIVKNLVVEADGTSEVIAATLSKKFSKGEEAVYELIIVNPGKKIRVYSILPEEVKNLVVEAEESIVTVPADSSKIVKIKVKALEEGTYSFSVNVNSEGKLIGRLNLNAVVEKGARVTSNSAVVLTIVLVIVLVVLLIVLIVLLTRKPAKEEIEESYY